MFHDYNGETFTPLSESFPDRNDEFFYYQELNLDHLDWDSGWDRGEHSRMEGVSTLRNLVTKSNDKPLFAIVCLDRRLSIFFLHALLRDGSGTWDLKRVLPV